MPNVWRLSTFTLPIAWRSTVAHKDDIRWQHPTDVRDAFLTWGCTWGVF